MGKFKIFIGISVVLAAMTSCHKEKPATVQDPVRVEVEVADNSSMDLGHTYSGTVKESKGSDLSFSVAGLVREMYVQKGDHVKKGQLIGVLDDTSLRSAYNIALQGQGQAQDTYNRLKKLYDAKSLPEMQMADAEYALNSAKNATVIAKKAWDDCKLVAPMDGYVSERYAEPGQTAAPGVPAIRLVTIDPVNVVISVPESEIMDMASGQKGTVAFEGRNARYEGRVVQRDIAANPVSHTYDVKIEVSNADEALLPGMICQVEMEDAAPQAKIVLPSSSVLLDSNNERYVWVVYGGHALKRVVDTGGITSRGIIIDSGVSPGDSVIVAGQQKVSMGIPVRIV